jgi:hypothetical protein
MAITSEPKLWRNEVPNSLIKKEFNWGLTSKLTPQPQGGQDTLNTDNGLAARPEREYHTKARTRQQKKSSLQELGTKPYQRSMHHKIKELAPS